NGTYSTTNRSEMQKEINQLRSEIDRIGKASKFNGISLFKSGGSITLHVGESGATYNQLKVSFSALSATALGIASGTMSISNSSSARNAISLINTAIDKISSMRSTFGALQNRLEHTINNLGVQHENLSAAESRIRDVDMAKEMMAYTKNNILVQASQAMLAQANQVPQGVLQLLQ
ncbi:MAG: flagellin, partial [Ruminococcus sp.]|nr:flagellin [Ruminococcus sp.]